MKRLSRLCTQSIQRVGDFGSRTYESPKRMDQAFSQHSPPENVRRFCDAVAGDLLGPSKKETAPWVAPAVLAYLRPCENYFPTIRSMVAGESSCPLVSLIISPLKLGSLVTNKRFDETVLLDDSEMEWLGKVYFITASSGNGRQICQPCIA